MHLFVIPFWFNIMAVEAVCFLAFWKGGWQERTVAGVHQFSAVLSIGCFFAACPLSLPGAPLRAYLTFDLFTDGAILAACLLCAARTDRYWAVVASAFALARVGTDLLGFQAGVSLWAYLSAGVIWRYLIDACIVWGVWSYQAQKRRRKRAPGEGALLRSAERGEA